MTTDDRHIAPFPLEGGRAGDGGGGLSRSEGSDRFDRDTRAKPARIARARKLRVEPTRTEEKLWAYLRKLSVRFRRQALLGPYTVDFACHRASLVIEVDGGVHNLSEVAVRDLRRDEWLAAQGYQVLRFTTKQVEDDPEGVLTAIRNASPLPLDGEGVGGWGGGRLRQNLAHEASSDRAGPSPSASTHDSLATTPSQPSPVEGEGSAHPRTSDANHQGGRALWRARDQWVRDDEN